MKRCKWCPLALVIGENIVEDGEVSVHHEFAWIEWWTCAGTQQSYSLELAPELTAFIAAFDAGENPAPIAVPLALPRSAWRVQA